MAKIKTLNATIWHNKAPFPKIARWLARFDGQSAPKDIEQKHALHLLQQFMFFGEDEIKELLHVIYRDLFRYPIVRDIRKSMGGVHDSAAIDATFRSVLSKTRFLGLGRAGESGQHLLYTFRQINGIPQDLCVDTNSIFVVKNSAIINVADPMPERIVFIDDVTGSGTQAAKRLKFFSAHVKTLNKAIQVCYFPLFATSRALAHLRREGCVDLVRPAIELDETYRCFSASSIYFRDSSSSGITPKSSEAIMRHYGGNLCPTAPLGFGDCQLLLGFQHNVPDNSLTPFWWAEPPPAPNWDAIFPRISKTAIDPNLL